VKEVATISHAAHRQLRLQIKGTSENCHQQKPNIEADSGVHDQAARPDLVPMGHRAKSGNSHAVRNCIE
jgi:hypothetical protein